MANPVGGFSTPTKSPAAPAGGFATPPIKRKLFGDEEDSPPAKRSPLQNVTQVAQNHLRPAAPDSPAALNTLCPSPAGFGSASSSSSSSGSAAPRKALSVSRMPKLPGYMSVKSPAAAASSPMDVESRERPAQAGFRQFVSSPSSSSSGAAASSSSSSTPVRPPMPQTPMRARHRPIPTTSVEGIIRKILRTTRDKLDSDLQLGEKLGEGHYMNARQTRDGKCAVKYFHERGISHVSNEAINFWQRGIAMLQTLEKEGIPTAPLLNLRDLQQALEIIKHVKQDASTSLNEKQALLEKTLPPLCVVQPVVRPLQLTDLEDQGIRETVKGYLAKCREKNILADLHMGNLGFLNDQLVFFDFQGEAQESDDTFELVLNRCLESFKHHAPLLDPRPRSLEPAPAPNSGGAKK